MRINATIRACARASWGARPAPSPRLLLLGLLATAAFSVPVSSASAVLVQLRGGKALSYQPLRSAATARASLRPFDAFFTNLDYNGGPIMPSNTNYTIYWAPSGSPAYPSGYKTGVNRYLEDLAHDSGGHENVDSVSTQYNDAAGEYAKYESHFGGELVDTDPYPTSGCSAATKCLTDAQLQTEIKKFVAAEGLPKGLSTEYFLLTPPKVESCFEASGGECSAGSSEPFYCAYHGNIPSAGTQIIYSNDPYVSKIVGCDDGNHPNGNASDGALEGGLSHEHNESITDPEPNNAWTNWAGEEAGRGEIGDKCGNEMGSPVGETLAKVPYNQVIDGHFYWYQEEWSNQGHQCLQRFTFSGQANTAKFNATAGLGTEVHLDAGASTASGGVFRYNWEFNDESGEPSPIETSSPAFTHTFKTPGTYVVALTIYSGNGTSIGAAKTIVVGAEAPTAAFSVTSPSPTVGQPVDLDASGSSAKTGSITSYEWEFGDGSSGSGITPTHTYAATGTYEAVLSVTDGSGLTAKVTHKIVVGPAAPPGSPTPVTEPSTNVEQTSATLNGTVNPNSGNVTDCHFEYGTTIAYGTNAPCAALPGAGAAPVSVSAAVASLTPNTTYHFRLVATNGSGEDRGSDLTFKTAATPPAVTTEPASSVGQATVTLNGLVNPNGTTVSDCRFEYGSTAAYGSNVPCSSLPGAGSGAVGVSATVSGLSPGTTYHFRVLATNAGGASHGLDRAFSTAAETPASSSGTGTPSLFPPPGLGPPVCCGTATETPSAAQIASQLAAQLIPSGKPAAIASILRQGGLVLRFTGPVAGTATVSWYYLPRGAKLASRSRIKPVLVASGRIVGGASASKPWSGTFRMKLTVAGRRLLRHSRRLKLTARCVFTRLGAAPVIARVTFSIKR